jgi:hypothetical protein
VGKWETLVQEKLNKVERRKKDGRMDSRGGFQMEGIGSTDINISPYRAGRTTTAWCC